MNDIVVAFPKQEVAQKIKRILSQSGFSVAGACHTGADALSMMQNLESGILVCGYRFPDMVYAEIYDYMPRGFQMLLVASAADVLEREVSNLICLSKPLKVHELLETVRMMEYTCERRRKRERHKPQQRTGEEQALLEQAKALLQERNGFSEEEAHRYMQKRSMDNGTSLVETAQMIISLMGGA